MFAIVQTKKLRDEYVDDMSVLKAFTVVLERRPDLRSVASQAEALSSYFSYCLQDTFTPISSE